MHVKQSHHIHSEHRQIGFYFILWFCDTSSLTYIPSGKRFPFPEMFAQSENAPALATGLTSLTFKETVTVLLQLPNPNFHGGCDIHLSSNEYEASRLYTRLGTNNGKVSDYQQPTHDKSHRKKGLISTRRQKTFGFFGKIA